MEKGIFKKITDGNRLYWLLAMAALLIPALLAFSLFAVGCRCIYGSVTAEVYGWGIILLYIRFFTGFVLGEKRKKIWIWLLLPFVIASFLSLLGQRLWPHLH